MRKKFFIKFIITLLLLSFGNTFSQSSKKINGLIKTFSNSEKMKNAQWSLYAEYVDTQKKIIDYQSNFALAPASGLKLLTTATVLDELGGNYRFTTKIFYDGKILKDRTLKGNIYLVGGGDPTLGSALVESSLPLDKLYDMWIKKIAELGIKKIEGNIIADDLLYSGLTIPGFWYYQDLGNYYAASSHALSINDNLYYIFFEPSKKVGGKASLLRTEPNIDNLKIKNLMKTGKKYSGDNGYVFSTPNQFNIELHGTIPAGVKEFSIKGSIPDPPLFAVQYFAKKLKESNIILHGSAKKLNQKISYEGKKLLIEYKSPPLKDIVYIINKKSFNLYTEMILRRAAFERYGKGSIEHGIKLIKNFLSENNIDTTALELYDGCGLSRSNIITTKMMVKLLSEMVTKKEFNNFYNSLGIAGNKNDLSSFKFYGTGTTIENNARIKSGFITGVRSHSGYLKDKKGRLIAFCFIANNFKGSTKQINNYHKRIMIELAELKK